MALIEFPAAPSYLENALARNVELSVSDVESLTTKLLDTDSSVRRDGLRLFSFLGQEAIIFLDAALKSRFDSNRGARSNVMDGVISCTKNVNPDQTRLILELANDPDELVREKVIAFIGAVSISVLRSAIDGMDPKQRTPFAHALPIVENFGDDTQALFDKAIAQSDIESTFALASLQRMARAGVLDSLPSYSGSSYLANGCLTNTRRLMNGAARRRSGVKTRAR